MKIKNSDSRIPPEFHDSESVKAMFAADDHWRTHTPKGKLQNFIDQFGVLPKPVLYGD